MADAADPLDRLVTAIRGSAKYRSVCEALIRNIGARELAKERRWKEAVQATRGRLHQVCGAYREGRLDGEADLARLRQAAGSGDETEWRAACRSLMERHASTRERLPILDRFYAETLADLGPIRSVLDVACGLNPLALAWMPLAPEAEYYACDADEDLVEFLNQFLALAIVRGEARAADVTQACPEQRVQVALVLKSLPCLERLDGDAGRRLLEEIQAEHLLVSFPAHSLGGRQKGMVAHYTAYMERLTAGQGWRVERYEMATELAFRLSR